MSDDGFFGQRQAVHTVGGHQVNPVGLDGKACVALRDRGVPAGPALEPKLRPRPADPRLEPLGGDAGAPGAARARPGEALDPDGVAY